MPAFASSSLLSLSAALSLSLIDSLLDSTVFLAFFACTLLVLCPDVDGVKSSASIGLPGIIFFPRVRTTFLPESGEQCFSNIVAIAALNVALTCSSPPLSLFD